MFKCILPFIFVASLFGQTNSEIKLIGHLGESSGDCYVVEVRGDTVFFVEGRGFKIVDNSDKYKPILISQCILPYNEITSIKIKGNYAYLLADESYLLIIDISYLSNPMFVKQYNLLYGNNIAVKDNLLYIAYGHCMENRCSGGFIILDVSDINSINERYNYKTNYKIFDITIKDTTAYLSVQDSILVFNIKNPDLPKKAAQFATGASSSSLCIKDNILYAVYPVTGMSVFNIDDQYNLKLIGQLDVSGSKAKLDNDHLFIVHKNGSDIDDINVAIVDVSSPDSPSKISEINMGDFGFSKSLDYSNNYLYVSHSSSGLYVLDVSDAGNPKEITRYKTGYKNDVVVNNNYAFLSSDYDGVQIIDITDKQNPRLIGKIDLKEHPSDRTKKVAIDGNRLYVMIERALGNFVNSVFIIDISSAANPKIISSFNTRLMTDIEVRNNIMYITDSYGFSIIDANDPANPVLLKRYSKSGGSGYDLTLSGNYAFIGEWAKGLTIIDFADTTNIHEEDRYNTFCVGEISVNQNTVYIIAQSQFEAEFSLRILDISNITNIKELGAIDLSNNLVPIHIRPKGVAFKNGKVIVGDYLKIIDVSNPENPKVIDSSNVCRDVNEIILDDKYIYVADGTDGLYIFQYDGFITSVKDADFSYYSFDLHQNYPNPFNPSTTICYSIPENGLVQLSIYNVLGQQVASLINKEQSKGNYKVEFDASSLSSGIYFYRLKSGNFVNTKKLLFLK